MSWLDTLPEALAALAVVLTVACVPLLRFAAYLAQAFDDWRRDDSWAAQVRRYADKET